AESRGLEVIIAGAGGAAHLPGMLAAVSLLPVLGVPVESRVLRGVDSLLSIVQMPKGIPVGTLAIGPARGAQPARPAAARLARRGARRARRSRGAGGAWAPSRQAQPAAVGEPPEGAPPPGPPPPPPRSASSAGASSGGCSSRPPSGSAIAPSPSAPPPTPPPP